MHRLTGITQNYAWGSHTLLSNLRGASRSAEPEAEIWYGAHEAAPSLLDDDRSLLSAIQVNAAEVLGDDVIDEHGAKLPFLLKLLAAAEPLSIQAHPTREQAQEGFARENAAGIARDAPHRSFRDDAPKPELIVALTPFEALVGFRPVPRTIDCLSSIGATSLENVVRSNGLVGTVRWALDPTPTERDQVDAALRELVERAPRCRDDRWHAEASAVESISSLHPNDPGILVAVLLNHVRLQPGEAVYLDAGTLHAYLNGLGVEIMGNSDNVMRGGLTRKHVDTANLLAALRDEATEVNVLLPGPQGSYETPASEFRLSRSAGHSRPVSGPSIILAVEGSTTVRDHDDELTLAPTDAVWLAAGHDVTATSTGTFFVAEVGHDSD